MEATRDSSSVDSLLHGLKFGQKIYFEDGAATADNNSSSSKPAVVLNRKGKGGGKQRHYQQQPQIPRCQVEGCKVDLTGSKAYYCRHKVCGMHSKAPVVIVGGIQQRFCQQCSRFHQLPEFDQRKRSCRTRLAGHNQRRRKPHQSPFDSRYNRLASLHEEPGRFRNSFTDFNYPRPSNNVRDVWSALNVEDRISINQLQGILDAPSASAMQGAAPCFHGSLTSSSCALSLLSPQPLENNTVRTRGPTYSTSSNLDDNPIAHRASNNFVLNAWGFRGHVSHAHPHEIQHAVGLGVRNGCETHFSGDLELALQGNAHCLGYHGSDRAYDHSNHGMH